MVAQPRPDYPTILVHKNPNSVPELVLSPWRPRGVALVPKWCHYGAMNLTGYVEALRQQLAVAAAAGGDEAQALAERLTAPLDAATRLVLLDALSAAAGEITRDLAPGSVDLRLRDREPTFVVTLPPAAETSTPDGPEPPEAAPSPAPSPEA